MERLVFAALITAAGLLAASPLAAAGLSDPPIRFLQGFAPGGNADVVSRVLGEELAKSLGQPVVSEARPGAGGNLASAEVAKAPPDGHTIVLLTTAHVISRGALQVARLRSRRGLHVDLDRGGLSVLFRRQREVALQDHRGVRERGARRPSAVTFATAGLGTGQHMAGELFGITIGARCCMYPSR